MNSYVILGRPKNGTRPFIVRNDHDRVIRFYSEEAAEEMAKALTSACKGTEFEVILSEGRQMTVRFK